jgi:hypothetical protein
MIKKNFFRPGLGLVWDRAFDPALKCWSIIALPLPRTLGCETKRHARNIIT